MGQLLASLQINPMELPGELPHIHDQAWHGVWNQQQQGQGPQGRPDLRMAQELAAGGQQAAWEGVWGAGR